ncbi:hypothetical protein [Melittangium boletus]|uniref:hypothetical protein n=1 Tax=Melittangium boletus TaxID=83453 RepID=UPI003DA2C68E
MKALRIRSLAVMCLLALPMTAGATDLRFEQGSLIIPEQMAYQSRCGAVASYGLVYRLLQQKVTIYWSVEPTKTSHHRCKNTSDDKRYIDGCDFKVEKETGQPVSLLSNSTGKFSEDFTTFSTTGNPNNTGEGAIKVDKKQTRLRYMGGPFIIDASEAAKAIALIKDHADFSLFRGPESTATCNPGTAWNVRVHRANNAFVAPVARIMNEVPPPIALVLGRNTSNAGSVEILRAYLTNAGLNFTGAEGTFDKHGKIFDVLDQDKELVSSAAYPKSKLNYAPDASAPNKTYYKVLWSPHWQGDVSTSTKRANLKSALSNIAHFVDIGNSIFNECASIETYESSYKPNETVRDLYQDNEPTRFMSGAQKKPGLQTLDAGELILPNGFAVNGQDCSDPGRTGDCYSYSNYGDLFSQKGDFELTVPSTSTVEAFRPRTGQDYDEGAVRMISTKSPTAAKDGWDLYVSRQKDNNKQKGNVIYLAGHTFAQLAGGNRIVLNTLLNLAYKPESLETSRSEPVADLTYDKDGKLDKMNVLAGTFLHTPPQALYPERINFRAEQAADWVFPYIEGRLRSYDARAIDTDRQTFSQNATWEASVLVPSPGQRTVFTVLGANQTGLKRVPFTVDQLGNGCVDDTSTGKIKKMCDLQEAMGLDLNSTGTSVLDPTGAGEILSNMTTLFNTYNHMSKHFLQRVRGYCVAHEVNDGTPFDVFTPTENQCDNRQFGEVRSTLGGLDHASAAVVGPSPYIKTVRPEVAYVGGLDGQLHAIYLRGTQAGMASVKPGTELWAFVPKGQLSRLSTNNARVDISPVVSDIYADYEDTNNDGVLSNDKERSTGKFRWRTVLVSGSGRLGGELFALDVTDPLKPLVLWDVVSKTDNTNTGDAQKDTAIKWTERWKDGDKNPPPPYLDPPTKKTGPFNYLDLGDTLTVNLVPVRRGNRPSYQVVVATNGGKDGAQQLQVFALEAGTGKKIWQWERPYGEDTSNSLPGGTSTLDVDGDGSMDRVYVGDMEGRVWELSAHTGANLNYFNVGGSPVSYPLYSTQDPLHPVTTVPAIMRLPYSFEAGSIFSGLGVGNKALGKLALVFGTAGADWVLARNDKIKGRMYVAVALPEDLGIRDVLSHDKVTPVPFDLRSPLANRGTVKSGAVTFLTLEEKERAVGSPKIVGSNIVLSTAYGTTESDPFNSNMQGRTHLVDLNKSGKAADKEIAAAGKAAAGVLVLPDGTIVTQTMTSIQSTPPKTVEVPLAGIEGKRSPVRIGSWLDLGRALAE